MKLSWCNNSISFGIFMSHTIGRWRNDLQAVRIIGVDQAYRGDDDVRIYYKTKINMWRFFLVKNIRNATIPRCKHRLLSLVVCIKHVYIDIALSAKSINLNTKLNVWRGNIIILLVLSTLWIFCQQSVSRRL